MVETNIVAVVYECLKHPLFKILCVGAPTAQKKHPQKPKTADSLPLAILLIGPGARILELLMSWVQIPPVQHTTTVNILLFSFFHVLYFIHFCSKQPDWNQSAFQWRLMV